MAETIGLQAVLEDANFQRGLANYMRGIDQMNRATGQASQSMAQSSGAIDGFGAAAGSAGGPIGALGIAVGNLAADLAVKLVSSAWDAVGSIVEFGKESILSAARVQELDYVIQILGERAGYSKGELDATVQSIRDLGIRTDVAQNLVAQFIRNELDLADATDLARIAQDAAVLSMSDSSDALQNLIYGITTQNSRVLRNAGVTTMAGQAMAAYAEQLGIAQDELTPAQRAQAVLNGVIEDGGRIAGAYEAAMEAPGKQLRSFKRYIDDLAVAMGTPLLDAFGGALSVGKDIIKFLIDAAQEGGFLNDVVVNLGAILSDVFTRVGAIVSALLAGEIDFAALIPPEVMQVVQSFVGLLIRLGNWWTEYGPQIQATSAEIFTGFQEAVQNLASQILPFIAEQLDRIGMWFTENGPLIAQYIALIQERFSGAAGFISGFWQVVEPILSGLLSLILNVAELVMQVFIGDWSAAWQTAGNILLVFRDTVIGFLGGLADWVASWFGTTWEGIRTQWSDNWEMFKIIVSNAWENIRNSVTTAIENVRTSISDKIDNIRQSWQDTWDSIQIILSTVWDTIKETIREELETIFASMGLDLDEMTEKWQAIWDDILLIASTIWDRITSAIQEKVDALRAWWEPKWDEFTETLRTIWSALVMIVTEKAIEVYNKITGKVQEIKDWWETNWNLFTDILGTIWSAIVTVVEEKVQEVYNKVTEKIEEIRSWIDGKIEQFKEVGANIIRGMKDGVLGAVGDLISAVTTAVQDAVNAAKSALGIDSPSRVFMDIGRSIGEGLATGIGKSTSLVTNAMNELMVAAGGGFGINLPPMRLGPTLAAYMVGSMGEILSQRFELAGALSALGSTAAQLLEKRTLEPLEAQMSSLDEQIEKVRSDLETAPVPAWLQMMEELERLEAERAQAGEEYRRQQEKIFELQKQQENLQFLQQQVKLLDLIAEHGLDAGQILGDMDLGVNASLENIVEAMSRATEAIIEQTEQELGFDRLLSMEEIAELERQRAEAAREYAEQQERILALEKAQADLAFLNDQIKLLNMIVEHGLDAEQILGGMLIGADASAEDYMEAMTRAISEIVRLTEEQTGAADEYIARQERILELQEAQAKLDFLKEQIKLLDMIADYGLDATQILGGMALGAEASAEDFTEAMIRAINAIIGITEQELQAQSPSRVFMGFGRDIMEGLAMGIEQFSSLPMAAIEPSIVPSLPSIAGMAGAQTFSNTTRGGDFNVENMNVNNGMDVAELRWFILETVREGI